MGAEECLWHQGTCEAALGFMRTCSTCRCNTCFNPQIPSVHPEAIDRKHGKGRFNVPEAANITATEPPGAVLSVSPALTLPRVTCISFSFHTDILFMTLFLPCVCPLSIWFLFVTLSLFACRLPPGLPSLPDVLPFLHQHVPCLCFHVTVVALRCQSLM